MNLAKISKLLTILIVLQFNFSCKSYSPELRQNFSRKQIKDLNRIRKFFINEIRDNPQDNFAYSFRNQPQDYLERQGKAFWQKIDFNKQKKLYQSISKSTFDEIWTINKQTNFKKNGKVYNDSIGFFGIFSKREVLSVTKSLGVNALGKYCQYLTDFGKHNPKVAKYAKRLMDGGDIIRFYLPYRKILRDYKQFDLNNKDIQLILAIHYLTLNDHDKRHKKWSEK